MPTAQPLLCVKNIIKSFPGVMALQKVSFDLLPGEIHGLVGENGAGKSTLMRILAGVYEPDSGTIHVQNQHVRFDSPHHAHQHGIGMVYQDTRLVGDLDVAQNIGLGNEPTKAGLINRAEQERRATKLLARMGLTLNPHQPVHTLSLAERQIVEISRALSLNPTVLILDEPTTGLDPNDVERLFKILRDVQAQGTGIIFISHRLPEVLALTDRITVMKDGAVVSTIATPEIDEDGLVQLMVGREISMAFPPKATQPGKVVLEVENFSSADGTFNNIALHLRAGEIVGLGGIQGNGQREIARALSGQLPGYGIVRFAGERIDLSSPREAINRGIVYLSSDRRGEALFLPHSVSQNISLPHLPDFGQMGVISAPREKSAVQHIINQLRIQTPSADQPVKLLSGGNQQKVVVGRWLISKPRVYIFDEPTQGVDVGTKLELYRIIRKLADEGAAVLVLSTEVIELMGLCDRILVVADGRIVDEVEAEAASEERIVGSAVKAGRQAQDDQTEQQQPATQKATWGWVVQRYVGTALILALIFIIGIYTQQQSEYFLKSRNLSNLALQITPLALVSMGVMATILVGGIDLSVGPTMSLITVIASYLIVADASSGTIILGIFACLAAGALVGLLNGVLIRYLHIPDLITTLASYTMVFGVTLILRPAPGGVINFTFMDAVTHRLTGVVPIIAVATLLLYIIGETLLVRGRIGMALYATGSNQEAALVAGLPINRIRLGVYIFSGLMAAVAGLVLAARIGSGDPQAGTSFTLSAVTAVVVGGTSIFGGRGTLLGTLVGAILVIETQNALNQLHVSAYFQYIWIGLLTLIAVAIYSIRENDNPLERLQHLWQRSIARPSTSTETVV